jgi:DNA invertase Pin-like site-specific DNA recombinase
MSAPLPYVVYASKSSKDVNDAIPTQLETVADRVASLTDAERVEYAGPFHEEAKSGYKRDRGPELEAALAAVERAAADHGSAELWVWRSERLARGSGKKAEARSLLEVYTRLTRAGVTIRSVLDDAYVQDEAMIGMTSKVANKYSADLSDATKAGKQRQYDRGTRPGGPVQDGMALRIERDDQDRIIARNYVPDREGRAPTIERLFDLSEEGNGDAIVAKRLNREGKRKKSGKPWDRRSVQAIIENQGYAGRIVRPAEGDRPAEVIEATNIEPLIDPERYDRIVAARVTRDRSRGDKRRRGGRPTSNFVLAKLAICDRCGSRLYARTSPYRRKDGTHKRQYMCAEVASQTGMCDQPPIDAESVDPGVVEYLDRLFVDFEAWQGQTESAQAAAIDAAQAAVDAAEQEVRRLDRLAAKVQADYLRQLEAGDDDAAQVAVDAKKHVEEQREARAAEVAMRKAALAELAAPTDDAMLDVWAELKRAVREGDDGVGGLNERLKAEFREFRLDSVADGEAGEVAILPVLLPRDVPDSPLALLRAWQEAGEPDPTPEEVADYEENERRGEAENLIVVPAKPLLIQKGQDTQL